MWDWVYLVFWSQDKLAMESPKLSKSQIGALHMYHVEGYDGLLICSRLVVRWSPGCVWLGMLWTPVHRRSWRVWWPSPWNSSVSELSIIYTGPPTYFQLHGQELLQVLFTHVVSPCIMLRLAITRSQMGSSFHWKLHSNAREHTIRCRKPWSHSSITLLCPLFSPCPKLHFLLYIPIALPWTPVKLLPPLPSSRLCLRYTVGHIMPPALHICALPVVYGMHPPVGSASQ